MSEIIMPNITTTVKANKDPDYSWLGGIGGILNTAYNLFTNKRDFDYQKALQQEIFQREDTAVQRRVADLKAAGLNPNLAAGAAASAGAVVGRSSTNDVNVGAALDNAAAVAQIKAQKIQNKILKEQEKSASYDADMKRMAWENEAWFRTYENDWYKYLYQNPNSVTSPEAAYREYNPRLYQWFDNMLRDQNNSSEILQKQNKWFNANQVINAAGQVGNVVTNGIKAATGIKRMR